MTVEVTNDQQGGVCGKLWVGRAKHV